MTQEQVSIAKVTATLVTKPAVRLSRQMLAHVQVVQELRGEMAVAGFAVREVTVVDLNEMVVVVAGLGEGDSALLAIPVKEIVYYRKWYLL